MECKRCGTGEQFSLVIWSGHDARNIKHFPSERSLCRLEWLCGFLTLTMTTLIPNVYKVIILDIQFIKIYVHLSLWLSLSLSFFLSLSLSLSIYIYIYIFIYLCVCVCVCVCIKVLVCNIYLSFYECIDLFGSEISFFIFSLCSFTG